MIKLKNESKIREYFEIMNLLEYFSLEDLEKKIKDKNETELSEEKKIENLKIIFNKYDNQKESIFKEKKNYVQKINDYLKEIDNINKKKDKNKEIKKKQINKEIDILKNKIKNIHVEFEFKEKKEKKGEKLSKKYEYLLILYQIYKYLNNKEGGKSFFFKKENKDAIYDCDFIVEKLKPITIEYFSFEFYYMYIKIIKFIIKKLNPNIAINYCSDICCILFKKNYNYLKQKTNMINTLCKNIENFSNVNIKYISQIIEYLVYDVMLIDLKTLELNSLITLLDAYIKKLNNNNDDLEIIIPYTFEYIFDLFCIFILKLNCQFEYNLNFQNQIEKIITNINLLYKFLKLICDSNLFKNLSKINFGKLILITIYNFYNINNKKPNINIIDFNTYFINKKNQELFFECLLDLLNLKKTGFYYKVLKNIENSLIEDYGINKINIIFKCDQRRAKEYQKNINNFVTKKNEINNNITKIIEEYINIMEKNILNYLILYITNILNNSEKIFLDSKFEELYKNNLNNLLIKLNEFIQSKPNLDPSSIIQYIIKKSGNDLTYEWDYIFELLSTLKNNQSFLKNKSNFIELILHISRVNDNNIYLNVEKCYDFINLNDEFDDDLEVFKIRISTNSIEKFKNNTPELIKYYYNIIIEDKNSGLLNKRKETMRKPFLYLLEIIKLYYKANYKDEKFEDYMESLLYKYYLNLLEISMNLDSVVIHLNECISEILLISQIDNEQKKLFFFTTMCRNIYQNQGNYSKNTLDFYEMLMIKFNTRGTVFGLKNFSENFIELIKDYIERKDIELMDKLIYILTNEFFVDNCYRIYMSQKGLINNYLSKWYVLYSNDKNDLNLANNSIVFFNNQIIIDYFNIILNNNQLKKDQYINLVKMLSNKFQYYYFFKNTNYQNLIYNILEGFITFNLNCKIDVIMGILSNIAFHHNLFEGEENYSCFTEDKSTKFKNEIFNYIVKLISLYYDKSNSISKNELQTSLIKLLNIYSLFVYSLTNDQIRQNNNEICSLFENINFNKNKNEKNFHQESILYEHQTEKPLDSLIENNSTVYEGIELKIINYIDIISAIFKKINPTSKIYFSILKGIYLNKEILISINKKDFIIKLIYIIFKIGWESETNTEYFSNIYPKISFPINKNKYEEENEQKKNQIQSLSDFLLIYFIDSIPDEKYNLYNIFKEIVGAQMGDRNIYLFELIKWKLSSQTIRDNLPEKYRNKLSEDSTYYKQNKCIFEILPIIEDNKINPNECLVIMRSCIYNLFFKMKKNIIQDENVIKNMKVKKDILLNMIKRQKIENNYVEEEKTQYHDNSQLSIEEITKYDAKNIFNTVYKLMVGIIQKSLIPLDKNEQLEYYIQMLDSKISVYNTVSCGVFFLSENKTEKILNIEDNNGINYRFILFLNSLGNLSNINIIKENEENNNNKTNIYFKDGINHISFNIFNFIFNLNKNIEINEKIIILWLEHPVINEEILNFDLYKEVYVVIILYPLTDDHFLIKLKLNDKGNDKINEQFIEDFNALFLQNFNIYVGDNYEILSNFLIKYVTLIDNYIKYTFNYSEEMDNNFLIRQKLINSIDDKIIF